MDESIRIAGATYRKHEVSVFRLKFRDGTSIGPTLLKRLWALAAGSEDVGVSRETAHRGPASVNHAYVVSASLCPRDLDRVEADLRRLLHERLAVADVDVRRFV